MFSTIVVQLVLQRRWEPWSWGVPWLAIQGWQWTPQRVIEADPLTTARELAQDLSIDHSMVIWCLNQIGKVKKLSKWVLHELNANQKIIILKRHLLLFYATTAPISQLDCDMRRKVNFYMTTSNNQLSRWTKKELQSTHQSQTCMKKRSWALFGGLLSVWSTTAFWILAEPLHLRKYAPQINETHRKRQCLQPGLVNRKGPVLLHDNARPQVAQPALQKLNKLGYKVLYSPDLSPVDYHFFKHLDNFLQGKRFHNQQDAENAVQAFGGSQKHGFLCYRNKRIYFLFAKMCWL